MEVDLRNLPIMRFAETPVLADEFARLAIAGRKRFIVSGASERICRPGDRWLVLNSRSLPVCVIETADVDLKRFCDVEPLTAVLDLGRDVELEEWRRVTRQRLRGHYDRFRPDMWLICERFNLLETFHMTLV